ncbi:SAM-dependent methyltransferase [Devosia pacifica]|uniref:SAM-dependent methyltransferase n=1 Tax=Devosia pacifica TaxID=1335967 RepID=A0A918S8N7_9HYPH|nr:50S ribosomal protein L11 methyltransferase [Devosia pacifica]GHA30335.1 SAM-dependent methyltransferase [Devosia pacifica]
MIKERLALRAVTGIEGLRLYQAHEKSRIGQLLQVTGMQASTPYWAYCWGGGLALAHHIGCHSDLVANRRVLDLGAGSGLVGIAAFKAGASTVLAAETDPLGRVALGLNAHANASTITLLDGDPTLGPPPPVDLILAGDVFYAKDIASTMLGWLAQCRSAGIDVIIGDPGRTDLPLSRLSVIARYAVGDFGVKSSTDRPHAGVYGLD